jgi:hypothetical protein
LSSYAAGIGMGFFSPQVLTFISGILSAASGVIWFIRQTNTRSYLTPEVQTEFVD